MKSFISLPPYIFVYYIHLNTKGSTFNCLFNLNKTDAPIVITRMNNRGRYMIVCLPHIHTYISQCRAKGEVVELKDIHRVKEWIFEMGSPCTRLATNT